MAAASLDPKVRTGSPRGPRRPLPAGSLRSSTRGGRAGPGVKRGRRGPVLRRGGAKWGGRPAGAPATGRGAPRGPKRQVRRRGLAGLRWGSCPVRGDGSASAATGTEKGASLLGLGGGEKTLGGGRGGAPRNSPYHRIWAPRPRGSVNARRAGQASEQGIRPKTLRVSVATIPWGSS